VSYSKYEDGRLSVCICEELSRRSSESEVCPNVHRRGSGPRGVQGEPEHAWNIMCPEV
jgi:hypothetical protein